MEQTTNDRSTACGQQALTDGERCCVCGEELFDHEHDYCEDCRDGDLEDVFERGHS
jgi:hypothetical protein